MLLIHGLSNTAWSWAPVARRLAAERRTVAMDLRGHGLSDAPTEAYTPDLLAEDVVAVAEGSGLLALGSAARVVLAGHGFGAIVATWAAVVLGDRCAGLVLVDGGWEDLETATGLDIDEFLRGLDEPPEVMRSLEAFLADRAAFDPGHVGCRPGSGGAEPPSSRRMPDEWCRRRDRMRWRLASGRCSSTNPEAALAAVRRRSPPWSPRTTRPVRARRALERASRGAGRGGPCARSAPCRSGETDTT